MSRQIIQALVNYKYIFVKSEFRSIIFTTVNEIFPKLNIQDSNLLNWFSVYLIEDISLRFGLFANRNHYMQWQQNNNRDIKSVIMMMLPFISDKNNEYQNIIDLNQILYNKQINQIPSHILKLPRDEVLSKYFNYSNFSIGLFNSTNKDSLLELVNSSEKLIHQIIHHNFVSILETLKIITGKLYVNWINIEPLNIYNYHFDKLYIKTITGLTTWESRYNNDGKYNFLRQYKGLWLGDFYNVIRNKYYRDAKKIKWTIFNKKINDQGYYMIQYVDKLLNLSDTLDYHDFEDLPENKRIRFSNKYHKLLNNLKQGQVTYLDYDFEVDIIKTILSWLINNYKHRFLIKSKNIIKLELKQEKDVDLEDQDNDYHKKLDKISNTDIIKYAKELEDKHLWGYLKEVVVNLQSTFYGFFLIANNKINHNYFKYEQYDKNNEENIKYDINLKNIYNIAKALSHNQSWNLLSIHYKSLDENTKELFWSRIFGNTAGWLNLQKNLDLQEGKELGGEYNNLLSTILGEWNLLWKEMIFQTLVRNGLISKFKVDLKLTNETLLPSDYNSKKKRRWKLLKEKINRAKNKWEKSYYYLTNKTYGDLDKIRIEGERTKIEYKSYFDLLSSDQLWYSFYTMDWISQINFFNHYINHQIIYITGATGTGKSTQVPKLLLYALKMYDYNDQGKIIGTQPRIPPTFSNTERIAKELGVPINQLSYTLPETVNTNNYYLQFKHQYLKHTRDNNPHLQLKIVTDGTLVEEMTSNPVLKEKIFKPGKDEHIYGSKNKYDIIIIDEAHEHNKNMDIILTLARATCFYNNSARLVIISATMDDDESIYRNYFKEINDNLVYPIKKHLSYHPIIGDEEFILNAVLLDRRFHISPLGETTQYKITDIYLGYDDNKIDNEIEGIKIVIDICRRTSTGEILLFSTGRKEIMKAVQILNQSLPEGDVALPYFSDLHFKYKDIIEKIDKKIKYIKNARNRIYLEWGVEYVEGNIPEGKYKRAIIVATNVAEASVTIPGLTFVVDNGYEKVNYYDNKTNVSSLQIEKISESSRIQRRGRVGRIGDGTVYYLYSKGSRKNIKPKYKITQDDISLLLLKLSSNNLSEIDRINLLTDEDERNKELKKLRAIQLSDEFKDERPNNFKEEWFWNPLFSPYLITVFNQNYLRINNYYHNYGKYKYPARTNLWKIISDQFLLNGIPIDSSYFPSPYFDSFNSQMRNLLQITRHYHRGMTGYQMNTLLDFNGTFYIIHPFENELVRNVNNKIIKVNGILSNRMDSIKMERIVTKLSTKMLLVNIKGEYLNVSTLNNLHKRTWKKTILADKLNQLSRVTILPLPDVYAILVGSGYNILEEVLEIIAMLNAINYSISSLASVSKKNPKITEFDQFYQMYNNKDSDLIALHNIIKLFKQTFSEMKMFKLISSFTNPNSVVALNFRATLKDQYRSIVKKFRKTRYTLDPDPKKFPNWNLLNWLKQNGKLNKESGFLTWLSQSDNVSNIIINDINKNIFKIEKWADSHYINYQQLIKFVEVYGNLILKIVTIKKDLDDDYNETLPLEWIKTLGSSFYKSMTNPSIKNKIIKTFLVANQYNIAIKTATHLPYYSPIHSPLTKALPRVLFRGSNQVNTLCSDISNSVLYLFYNVDFEISIMTNITPQLLAITLPLYYNSINFKNLYLTRKNHPNKKMMLYKLEKIYGNNWNYFINSIRNNWSDIYFIWDTPELPIIRDYLKNIRANMKRLI